jgi:chemotaxis protein methyltransferase CheR
MRCSIRPLTGEHVTPPHPAQECEQASGNWRGAAAPPALSPAEFDQIRRMAYRHFGLDLKDGKQMLVVSRLGKTMRRQGFTSFTEYCRHVTEDVSGAALVELGDALSTNFTSFLREPQHFEFLCNQLAPRLPRAGKIEIWCAASSTGEEPYSILFTLLEALGPAAEVRVLATDISTRALAAAAQGMYQEERVEALPEGWLRKYFLRGNGSRTGWYRVKDEYRQRVRCGRFNLIADGLPAAHFPAIFCRNVMIYFDKPTQGEVVRRLASVLEPGGYLFIGHAESLTAVEHGLEYTAPALYRKPGKGAEWQNPGR